MISTCRCSSLIANARVVAARTDASIGARGERSRRRAARTAARCADEMFIELMSQEALKQAALNDLGG